jgi:hypothetical protein
MVCLGNRCSIHLSYGGDIPLTSLAAIYCAVNLQYNATNIGVVWPLPQSTDVTILRLTTA